MQVISAQEALKKARILTNSSGGPMIDKINKFEIKSEDKVAVIELLVGNK